MNLTAELERGRASFARREWLDAFTALSSADRDARLEPEDLERLATAAYLVGMYPECEEIWARGHHAYRELGDTPGAARCAFWLGLGLVHNGEAARAGGWFSRAGRVLADVHEECVEQGLLVIPAALGKFGGGDAEGAREAFARAAEIGDSQGEQRARAPGSLRGGPPHGYLTGRDVNGEEEGGARELRWGDRARRGRRSRRAIRSAAGKRRDERG